ncbi:MAG: hypothetical protein IJ019_01025 [Alphaproteobacteria bacterium]|nr:hypothetical protein [Alphaproteobacteria bacterium]
MAEETDVKQKADRLFELISIKDMSNESKASAAAIIKENPQILISSEFVEKIAPQNMNLCPKDGYVDFVENASVQQGISVAVLDNLKSLHSENLIPSHKEGKTPVQYMLDEAILPNGETFGTQTVKNITFLRALQNDGKYPDKTGMKDLHDKNVVFLHDIFAKEGYGSNPNRRNVQGQKAGDIIESHLDAQSKMKKMSVSNLQSQASQRNASKEVVTEHKEYKKRQSDKRTMTVEELRDKAYQGTLTVEQAEQLKKEDAKKEGDVTERSGDVQTPSTERDKEKFSKGDVVEYMYTEWFLGLLTYSFDKVEDFTLGIVDSAAGVFIEGCKRKAELKDKIKDEKLRDSHKKVENFAGIYDAVLKGRKDAYNKNGADYKDVFADLSAYVSKPNTHKLKYTYNQEFLDKLKKDKATQDFIKCAQKKVTANVGLMQSVDKLALSLSQIEMTYEFMNDEKTWKKEKKPKTNDELKQDLEDRALKRQKSILKSVAIIEEDTRLLAEIAYRDVQNPSVSKEQFIQQAVNQEVNAYIQELGKAVDDLANKQKKDLDNDHFAKRGKGKPDLSIFAEVKALDESIGNIVKKGEMYNKKLFSEEKSKEVIESKCSLFDEAVIQNKPSVHQRCQEYSQSQIDILTARRQQNNERAQKLADFKKRFAMRDGTKTIDNRVSGYQKDISRG